MCLYFYISIFPFYFIHSWHTLNCNNNNNGDDDDDDPDLYADFICYEAICEFY